MRTIERRYRVSFLSPAFLGNADQSGQWRTPPFKALLRHWWRIAAAADHGYCFEKMREAEGRLFGDAADTKAGSHRSRVMIRLADWSMGELTHWRDDPRVHHPEVEARQIGAHLYLGYGPLTYANRATALKEEPAIAAGAGNTLDIRAPVELDRVIPLVQWFGTLGGRSRNGWGSLHLQPLDGAPKLPALSAAALTHTPILRDWRDCLKLTWPHALGKDGRGPLVWVSKTPFQKWADAMKALASIKIRVRTNEYFAFKQNQDVRRPIPENRHVLAYPVTNHGVDGWSEKNPNGALRTSKGGKLLQYERWANQIRFKLLQHSQGLMICIAHIPCALPDELRKEIPAGDRYRLSGEVQERVWETVHSLFDSDGNLDRLT